MSPILESKRLSFHPWSKDDLGLLVGLNMDEDVMHFFPSTQDATESEKWLERQMGMFEKYGFCYFKTIEKETNDFVGIIGLSMQEYKSPFNPSVDLGYRIHKAFWNKGMATEGGKACLNFAKELGLTKISCVASKINKPSIQVMEKLGFTYQYDFIHSSMESESHLQPCVFYQKEL